MAKNISRKIKPAIADQASTGRKQPGVAQEQSDVLFRVLFDLSPDAVVLIDPHDPDGLWPIIDCNTAACLMNGYRREELVGHSIDVINATRGTRAERDAYMKMLREAGNLNIEVKHRHKSGVLFPVETSTTLITVGERELVIGIDRDISERKRAEEALRKAHDELEQRVQERTAELGIANEALKADIAGRKQAEEKIRRQLAHLTALGEIDRAIASGFDLHLNLTTLLVHAVIQLDIDAAAVLLFNPNSLTLEYIAQYGFQGNSLERAQPRLDTGYAGRAIQDRQIVRIPNIKDQRDDEFLTRLWVDAGFVSYYGVPLIAKGHVMGVLEIFKRVPLEPDMEWLDFLRTLAGQAAIAIDNDTLFTSLQRSNSELSLAYDATIEGWSHALDLRDRETEGHSQRVTEMTMELARAFDLSKHELVQVRRGALLHDIGKMGIPDAILLKPGPLTTEEWALMRKHPTFAYEMLAPIQYLRPALDIPYCHHEKWDGTGYPRGLKGEEIPLAARLFAVVDVWDALCSERPYRAAWPEEKVREHIQSLSGIHFEQRIVKTFLGAGDFHQPRGRGRGFEV